ncbi:MAG: lipopolysaccharide assembly protein LapA domain-containing protein [Lysobacterales bacterium]
MSRFFTLLLVVLFVAGGLFFGTLNETPVTVDLFFVQIQWPLALIVMSAFLAGIILSGTLVYFSMWLGVKRRIRSLKASRAKSAGDGRSLATNNG